MLKKKENMIVKFLFVIICILPFILQIQGIDIDDTGSHIYTAANLFDSSVNLSTAMPFSVICNFIFYKAVGFLGILGMYSINSAICVAAAITSYFIIKNHTSKITALIGLIFAELLYMSFIHMLNYNSYTALITTLAGLLLFIGIEQDKNKFIIISGALSSFSVFFRIPNIVSIALITGILYWAIIEKKGSKYFLKKFLLFTIGFVSILCVCIGVLVLLNNTTSLNISLFNVSGGEDSYSLVQLIKLYIGNFLDGIKYMYLPLAFVVISIVDIYASDITSKFGKIFIHIVNFGVIAVFSALLILNGISDNFILVLVFLCAYCFFVVFSGKKNYNPKLSLLILIGIIIAVTQFTGSNTGISHAKLGLFILLPTIIFGGVTLVKQKFNTIAVANKAFISITAICLCFAFLYQFAFVCTTYFEPSNRSNVVYSFNSSKAQGLYTNKYRVDYTNKAVEKLTEIDNKYMITYSGKDLLFYLSDKISPTGSIGFSYDSYKYNRLNSELENMSEDKMPIIFMSNIATYSGYGGSKLEKDDKYRLLEDFINTHNYNIYYSDDEMTIYIP